MNLEDQVLDNLGNELQKEIDKEILWGMLTELGWTRVILDRLQDNNHAIDIGYWLEENCKGPYERNGRDFIFEDSRDAMMFILKWK
jgi:hypothetical protein